MPTPAKSEQDCLFCKIVRGEILADKLFEDADTLAFLDHRPLFPGHCLLIPKIHFETLGDLPPTLVAPFFSNVQLLAVAIEHGINAEGTFVALNNRISQSVPHFHVHIVPRRKGDGLKGFFWPRSKYKSTEEITEVLNAIRAAIAQLQKAKAQSN